LIQQIYEKISYEIKCFLFGLERKGGVNRSLG